MQTPPVGAVQTVAPVYSPRLVSDRRRTPRPAERRKLVIPDSRFAMCKLSQEPKVRAWALESIATVLSWDDSTPAEQMLWMSNILWYWEAGSWKPKAALAVAV